MASRVIKKGDGWEEFAEKMRWAREPTLLSIIDLLIELCIWQLNYVAPKNTAHRISRMLECCECSDQNSSIYITNLLC